MSNFLFSCKVFVHFVDMNTVDFNFPLLGYLQVYNNNTQQKRYLNNRIYTQYKFKTQFIHQLTTNPISMIRKAKQHFDYDAVKVFETLFSHQLPEDETSLAFNKAVALLNRLGFKHYGDGKYPLPHYLREIVGNKKIVSFPNFLQVS